MGTPIQDVYRKFLGMIEDEEWLLVENCAAISVYLPLNL